MLGGLRYNRYDLMEMKCGYSYFRVIFQRIHKFPEFINRKEIFMNKAHCFLRVALTFALALSGAVAYGRGGQKPPSPKNGPHWFRPPLRAHDVHRLRERRQE